MKICSKCNREISEEVSFCNYCGEQQPIENQNLNGNKNLDKNQNEVTSSAEVNKDYDKLMTMQDASIGTTCGYLAIVMSVLKFLNVPLVHIIGLALGVFAIIKSLSGLQYKNNKGYIGLVCGTIAVGLAIFAIFLDILNIIATKKFFVFTFG